MFKIPNLNSLTIPYLKKIADECDIILNKTKKADIIRIISNSNISKDKLNNLVKKYLKEKQSTRAKILSIREKSWFFIFNYKRKKSNFPRRSSTIR